MSPEVANASDAQIGQSAQCLGKQRALGATDIEELPGHLRDQIAELREKVWPTTRRYWARRNGWAIWTDSPREFAREHSERLWKQLAWAATVVVMPSSVFAWS